MTRVFDINTSNDRGLVLFSSVFFGISNQLEAFIVRMMIAQNMGPQRILTENLQFAPIY